MGGCFSSICCAFFVHSLPQVCKLPVRELWLATRCHAVSSVSSGVKAQAKERAKKKRALEEAHAQDVTLPIAFEAKLDSFTMNPREFTSDMVFALLQSGFTLTVLDSLPPVIWKHTNMGGHLSSASQAETYVRPGVMAQQCDTALVLL